MRLHSRNSLMALVDCSSSLILRSSIKKVFFTRTFVRCEFCFFKYMALCSLLFIGCFPQRVPKQFSNYKIKWVLLSIQTIPMPFPVIAHSHFLCLTWPVSLIMLSLLRAKWIPSQLWSEVLMAVKISMLSFRVVTTYGHAGRYQGSDLKMETECLSKTLVSTCKSTRHHNPEQWHHPDCLKSYTKVSSGVYNFYHFPFTACSVFGWYFPALAEYHHFSSLMYILKRFLSAQFTRSSNDLQFLWQDGGHYHVLRLTTLGLTEQILQYRYYNTNSSTCKHKGSLSAAWPLLCRWFMFIAK
jgi:hypothetical protein